MQNGLSDGIDIATIGMVLNLLVDDKGNFQEEVFDMLLPMIGDLFAGGIPSDIAVIFPPDVQELLLSGASIEEIGPALKDVFENVLVPALPTVIGWAQSGLNSGTTKTFAYLPDGISEEGLFDALRNGNSFLTNGPILLADLNGQMPDNRYGFEAVLNANGTATLNLEVISNRDIDYIFVIADGKVIHEIIVDGKSYDGGITLNLSGYNWVMIDVWGEMNTRAFSSPIFLTTADTAADKAAKAELSGLIKDTLIGNPTVKLVGFEELDGYIENLKEAIDSATVVLFDKDAAAEEVAEAVAMLRAAIDGATPITSLKITTSTGAAAAAMVAVGRNRTVQFGLALNEGASNVGVVWTTSNANLATVNAEGLVTIRNMVGTVTLTARDPDSGITHSIVMRIA